MNQRQRELVAEVLGDRDSYQALCGSAALGQWQGGGPQGHGIPSAEEYGRKRQEMLHVLKALHDGRAALAESRPHLVECAELHERHVLAMLDRLRRTTWPCGNAQERLEHERLRYSLTRGVWLGKVLDRLLETTEPERAS